MINDVLEIFSCSDYKLDFDFCYQRTDIIASQSLNHFSSSTLTNSDPIGLTNGDESYRQNSTTTHLPSNFQIFHLRI